MEEKSIKVSIIGAGGCGGNIIADVYKDLKEFGLPVEFCALNTDVQALNSLKDGFPNVIQIGERSTGGLGAGSNPEVGKAAAQEDIEKIRNIINEKDLVIIIAGLGGGTGSGLVPIILKETKERDILTLCWFVIPSDFEGSGRLKIARSVLKEMPEFVDSFVVISNDATESGIFKDAMIEINNIISNGIQIVLEVLLRPSFINLDFADFRTVVKSGGKAVFSFGSFDGNNRSKNLTKEMLKFSLQTGISAKKVKKALIFVRGGSDMRKEELKDVVENVRNHISEDALIIMGISLNENKQSLDGVLLGTYGE